MSSQEKIAMAPQPLWLSVPGDEAIEACKVRFRQKDIRPKPAPKEPLKVCQGAPGGQAMNELRNLLDHKYLDPTYILGKSKHIGAQGPEFADMADELTELVDEAIDAQETGRHHIAISEISRISEHAWSVDASRGLPRKQGKIKPSGKHWKILNLTTSQKMHFKRTVKAAYGLSTELSQEDCDTKDVLELALHVKQRMSALPSEYAALERDVRQRRSRRRTRAEMQATPTGPNNHPASNASPSRPNTGPVREPVRVSPQQSHTPPAPPPGLPPVADSPTRLRLSFRRGGTPSGSAAEETHSPDQPSPKRRRTLPPEGD